MSFWQRSSQNPVEIIVKWVLISFLNTQQMTITWMSCARLGRQKSHGKNAHMKRIFHADWKPGRKTAELCGFPSLIVCQCAAHAALLEHSVIRKIFVWSSNTPTKSSFHWSGSVAKPFGCEVMPPPSDPPTPTTDLLRCGGLGGGGRPFHRLAHFALLSFTVASSPNSHLCRKVNMCSWKLSGIFSLLHSFTPERRPHLTHFDRWRRDAVFSGDLVGNQAHTRETCTRALLQIREEKIGPR